VVALKNKEEYMNIEVKRIDHLGIVAGTIKDLGIVDMINTQVGYDGQEHVTAGEIIAGMILNGLGFIGRPLMLTPQFFENKALEILIRKGITHDHFNRHKIGRVLDAIGNYGSEKLFQQIALDVCIKEKVNMRFAHADTTSYSLSGDYDTDSDTERITVTYGHSKAKRPDLKQVVQELVTSQDGGIPFITKAWDGNASDSVILRERATSLITAFSKSESSYFTADSKLYSEKTAPTLDQINFITRVPSTLKLEKESIELALQTNSWYSAEKEYKLQEFPSDCYNIRDQRWIVVYSKQARDRSEKTLTKEVAKENDSIKKELFHLQAQRFSCETDAKKALKKISKKWKYHQATEEKVTQLKQYAKAGRPTANSPQEYEWQIQATAAFNQTSFNNILDQRSCFVLATNISAEMLSMPDVLLGYKGQDKTEKGFAFLKSPEFFTSSLFLKKPSRIDGLLMIMVLSLLVYSVAQRRLRNQLASLKSTLPNQINKPTATPTMRWIFQLFEGIHYITITVGEAVSHVVDGLTELRKQIISLLCAETQKIYQISNAKG
jgi:transposase